MWACNKLGVRRGGRPTVRHPDKLLRFAHSNLTLLSDRLLAHWRCVRKAKLVCAKNAKWLLFNPNNLQRFAQ
jgi:hypothetical protein